MNLRLSMTPDAGDLPWASSLYVNSLSPHAATLSDAAEFPVPVLTSNLQVPSRYQEALHWRKLTRRRTKGGCNFLFQVFPRAPAGRGRRA